MKNKLNKGDWVLYSHSGAWENGGEVLNVEKYSVLVETLDGRHIHVSYVNSKIRICKGKEEVERGPFNMVFCNPGMEFLLGTVEKGDG